MAIYMGVVSGAGIAYPSEEPGFNPVLAMFALLSPNYEFVPRSGETIFISMHLGSLCFVYLIYSFFSTFCNNKKLEYYMIIVCVYVAFNCVL